jgi:predicted ABC-type ATPase
LSTLRGRGYAVHLVFLWLASPELALQRVAQRVALGGHGVPTDVIERRYRAGLANFFQRYLSVASTWRFYDASGPTPKLLARQLEPGAVRVYDRALWDLIAQQNGA